MFIDIESPNLSRIKGTDIFVIELDRIDKGQNSYRRTLISLSV